MYRFFTDSLNVDTVNGKVTITGSDVNHIKNVLRMKEGDTILVSDGVITDVTCKITKINSDFILTDIIAENEDNELSSRIVLFQGLAKGDKMEFVIQKATELGVSEVVPVAMKRCVVKFDDKKAANKIKRYEAVCESAAKQSKRSIIPTIHSVLSYKEALEYAKELDVCLVPYEAAKNMDETRKVINSIEKGKSIGIFIGPEGGFDEEEISNALEYGFKPITLGRRILRTETAGLTVLSILMYMLED